MSEPTSLEDVVAAARLLALGLRPKQIPSRDLVYADLVNGRSRTTPLGS